MNTRKTGREKEELACRYLEGQGYEILATNYWCRYAEVDIIAREAEGDLVFAEVKYRKSDACGGSLYAVPQKKRRRIVCAAKEYLVKQKIPLDTSMRFDVIAIEGDQIQHIPNAFWADGSV